MRRAALLVALGLAVGARAARAQGEPAPPQRDSLAEAQRDSVAAVQRADSIMRQQRTRGDSVRPRPPITPTNAFLRSLLLPGWGQARLGRNTTGGLFVAFEGLAAAMVWKSQWQLQFARTRNKYVDSHRQEREDWIVLLLFNHLMSGAEAYVSAHLFDFPAALRIDRLPGGRTGIGVTIPLQ